MLTVTHSSPDGPSTMHSVVVSSYGEGFTAHMTVGGVTHELPLNDSGTATFNVTVIGPATHTVIVAIKDENGEVVDADAQEYAVPG